MEKDILARVSPSRKEEDELMQAADEVISSIKIKGATPKLGGSAAKGTWLRGDNDIDIYVKFDKADYSGKDLSPILKKELEKEYQGIDVLHGSRDYFQFNYKGYTFEVVPILNIKNVDEAENITDVSPFHVLWVKKHEELKDEIRLTKAFLKANRIYGAESYIQGFSGYVLEILTIYYGGFRKLLEGIVLWKEKEVIDPEGHHLGKNVLKLLNKSKTVSPLILVDPVQDTRNAAAGLGKKSFEKLKELASAYLQSPSDDFFEEKKMNIKMLKEKATGKKLLLFEVEPVERKKDVAGAKAVKCLGMIKKHFMMNGFKVIEHGWEWDKKALLWLIFDPKILPKTMKHYGPPIKSEKRMEGFRKKWKGKRVSEENGRSYVVVDREYRTPEDFAKVLVKKAFIKDKVKSIRIKKS